MTWIDYTQLPPSAGGYTQLFFDFLNNSPDTRPFYRLNFRENSCFEQILREQQERIRDRGVLTAVLREQNEKFGATQRTRDNIAALEHASTLAVVTGQQVGSWRAVLHDPQDPHHDPPSRTAEREIPAIFVPVFWLEGEDHDFAEMNHAQRARCRRGLWCASEYLPGGLMPERNPGPVGEIVFDATIESTVDRPAVQPPADGIHD